MIRKTLELLYFQLISANKVAQIKGVQFGKNCKFRTKHFGSEPYLIKIGDNVSTARNVTFITHDGAVQVIRSLYKEYEQIDLIDQIIIQNNVFIGSGTTLLPGTHIEDNVIVGAGSVVRGRLKGNSVYAGVPVKYICSIDEYLNKNIDKFIDTKFLSKDKKRELLKEKFNINK